MNALDSPLEALDFNYLSYGVLTAVNNIWTVFALLTAAVSVWRIRSSVSPKSQLKFSSPPETSAIRPCSPTSISSSYLTSAAEPASSMQAECSTASKVSSSCFESTDGTTRGKFTVYYNEENVVESKYSDGDGDGDGCCYGGECWWEGVLRMKSGDMGWYRCQDLTVFDGNVVKFWDSCRPGNGVSGEALLW